MARLPSEYRMFTKGPSKALKCLRFFLRNPDATVRMGADACGTSYNVAWEAKSDIAKNGVEAMLPLAKFDATQGMAPEPHQKTPPKVESLQVEVPADKEDEVLDVVTNPSMSMEELATALSELGFERVTTPVVRSKDYIPKPQVHETPLSDVWLADNAQQAPIMQPLAGRSDGSTASYYELPAGAKELQDLISYKNMNAQIGEIFRACMRYGESSHSDELRDAKKIKFYIDAEIRRLGG